MKVYSSKDLTFWARESLLNGFWDFCLGTEHENLYSNNHLRIDLFGETIYITNGRWNIESLQHDASEEPASDS